MSHTDNAVKLWLRQNNGMAGSIGVFAILYLLYNVFHPTGFSTPILVQNMDETVSLALVAMGQTMPVLLGGIDLSVGAVMTMVGCLASHLVTGGPAALAMGCLICLCAGALFGALNGVIVVYGRIQPIIATLATGAAAMGIALLLRPYPGGHIDRDLSWAMTSDVGEFCATFHLLDDGHSPWVQPIAWMPMAMIVLAAAIGLWVAFRRTVTGRTVLAVGSAEGAAHMSGLAVARAKIVAFTLAGFFAGCAGLFFAIQTASGNADIPQADGYTLGSVAAVVLGGTALTGGRGSAVGSVFGAFILRAISFNFRIFDVPPLYQPLLEGIVLLVAVSFGAARVFRVRNTLELFK